MNEAAKTAVLLFAPTLAFIFVNIVGFVVAIKEPENWRREDTTSLAWITSLTAFFLSAFCISLGLALA